MTRLRSNCQCARFESESCNDVRWAWPGRAVRVIGGRGSSIRAGSCEKGSRENWGQNALFYNPDVSMVEHCQQWQLPTSGLEPELWPSLTVSLSAMTLWNSKPQENLQSLKYLSQLRNLTCRALKGQCQRSVALSPTVLCGKICDFYRLISPFSVSAPYVSPRKAIPHRCICTTHFGCSIADRGWAHFEMMTAKQLIHLSQARFFRFITWKNT